LKTEKYYTNFSKFFPDLFSLWKIIIADENKVQETIKDVIRSLLKSVKARGERDETIDLLIKLITSKLPKITIEVITKMVDDLVIDMKKTRVGRDLIDIGRSEGKIEGKTESALEMLKDHIPVDKIAIYTGLDRKEILSLANRTSKRIRTKK
jgi:predicted transposase YdaD